MKANRDLKVVFKESNTSQDTVLKAIFKSIDSVRKEQKNEKQQSK